MSIGGRNLNQGHVQRQDSIPQQSRYLAQEYRDVVGVAIVNGRPNVGSHKERVREHPPTQPGSRVRSAAFGVQVYDFQVVYLTRSTTQCVDKHLGRGRGGMDKDTMPRLNNFDCLICGGDLHVGTLLPPGSYGHSACWCSRSPQPGVCSERAQRRVGWDWIARPIVDGQVCFVVGSKGCISYRLKVYCGLKRVLRRG